MLIDAGRDRIRTLRAVGAQRDPLTLRLDLERALGAADLRPRGLPPSAIVCVRRMRVAIPARKRVEWASGLDGQIAQLLPGIARPFRDAVSANASAVLFADEAELLACLARDWARGASGRWWWRSLFGSTASEALVQNAFERSSMFVPAALEMLGRTGDVVDVLRALPGAACESVAAGVAATFAISGWSAPPSSFERVSDAASPAQRRRQGVAAITAQVRTALSRTAGVSSSDIQGLATPQRTLLTLAVVLRHAPELARDPDFASVVGGEAWLPARSAIATEFSVAASSVDPPAESRQSVGATSGPIVPVAAPSAGTDDRGRARRAQRDEGEPTGAANNGADPRRPGVVIEPEDTAGSSHTRAEQRASRSLVHTDRFADSAIEVHSAFAGVFYLVNLAIHLELYGDFTQPARPGLALPPGDFLALVGERACGEALRQDPVWEVLAQLSNRATDVPPGSSFISPDSQAAWLDATMQRLEARAALAFGVGEGAALPFVCAREGRITVTASRVDVTFSLVTHPLAIRIAGLDRNPGWLPAAGRVFEFHYDEAQQ